MKKRILALMLCLALILGMGAPVYAEETFPTPDGAEMTVEPDTPAPGEEVGTVPGEEVGEPQPPEPTKPKSPTPNKESGETESPAPSGEPAPELCMHGNDPAGCAQCLAAAQQAAFACLYAALMSAESIETTKDLLSALTEEEFLAFMDSLTEEQRAVLEAHLDDLEELEEKGEFTEEELATFTGGLYVNGVLLYSDELCDYLFSLEGHAFKLATNQMDIDQAGSLEGVVDDEHAQAIVDAMCHGGFYVGDQFLYPSTKKMRGLGMVVANTAPVWPAEGAIKLDKDASAVAGETNLWEVTLGIQGKNYTTTSDVVLVIDNSNSMYTTSSRMANTKTAAKAFAQKLLTENGNTRIAVVVYGTNLVDSTGFYTYGTISDFNSYIDRINRYGNYAGKSDGGGTNIQAGIHQADILLYSGSSTGILKNIVLLSDGEPTYSYPFVSSGIYASCNSLHILAGQYGGNITNIGSFVPDYTTIIGTGGSYNTDYNAYVDATCSHGRTQRHGYGVYNLNGSVSTSSGTNNGAASIWEANQTKAKGTTIYSVALQAGANGEYVLKESSTDSGKGYFTIADNDNVEEKLTGAFSSIVGRIAIAASNGKVIDPMGEKVKLSFSGDTPIITNSKAAYDQGKADVYISQGSAAYNTANQTITWNVNNVSEGDNPVMKYKVAIKDGVSVNTGEVLDTNKTTTFNYKDYQQNDAVGNFPIPKVTVGGGTILVHWYRVDADGWPVNEGGDKVGSPALAYQLDTAAYFEYNGSTGLSYNTAYTVTKRDFPDSDYSYSGQYIPNDGSLTTGDSATITLTAINSNQHIWFAYVLDESCTLTIKKEGWNSIDEHQSFLFQVKGAKGTDTADIDLTVTVLGNGQVTITDLPKGSYIVTEDTGWSWRYMPESNGLSVAVTPKDENKVTFTNEREAGFWLSGSAEAAVNTFGATSQRSDAALLPGTLAKKTKKGGGE